MTSTWIRGTLAAFALIAAGGAAQAAIVPDASLDANGTVTYADEALSFDGTFYGSLSDEIGQTKTYDLNFSLSYMGATVLSQSLPAGTFSIGETIEAAFSQPSFDNFVSLLTPYVSNVTFPTERSIAGAFAFSLDSEQSAFLIGKTCSLFAVNDCTPPSTASFALAVDLTPSLAPVPLPAGLPLLLAGLAGFAGLRFRRS